MAELDAQQSIRFCLIVIGHEIAFYLSVGRTDPEGDAAAARRLARADRGLLTVIALAFATSLGDAAIIPVLPEIRDGFGLSGVETGMLLSATTLAMLGAAVPVGLLAGRLGTRRLLLASAVLLPLSMLGQALAPGLGTLLAARMVFGLSFGILWTIGPALAAGGGRGAAGTGKLIAASGAGWPRRPRLCRRRLRPPGLPHPVLRHRGTVCAARAGARVRSLGRPPAPACRLRDAVAAARSERALGGATLVTALLGVVTGVSGLVAPLVLSRNGLGGSDRGPRSRCLQSSGSWAAHWRPGYRPPASTSGSSASQPPCSLSPG